MLVVVIGNSLPVLISRSFEHLSLRYMQPPHPPQIPSPCSTLPFPRQARTEARYHHRLRELEVRVVALVPARDRGACVHDSYESLVHETRRLIHMHELRLRASELVVSYIFLRKLVVLADGLGVEMREVALVCGELHTEVGLDGPTCTAVVASVKARDELHVPLQDPRLLVGQAAPLTEDVEIPPYGTGKRELVGRPVPALALE